MSSTRNLPSSGLALAAPKNCLCKTNIRVDDLARGLRARLGGRRPASNEERDEEAPCPRGRLLVGEGRKPLPKIPRELFHQKGRPMARAAEEGKRVNET